jgi:hypothetical protein
MVGHQGPGIDGEIASPAEFGQAVDKIPPVQSGSENLRPFNSPPHDMVQGSGSIQSGVSWHIVSFVSF